MDAAGQQFFAETPDSFAPIAAPAESTQTQINAAARAAAADQRLEYFRLVQEVCDTAQATDRQPAPDHRATTLPITPQEHEALIQGLRAANITDWKIGPGVDMYNYTPPGTVQQFHLRIFDPRLTRSVKNVVSFIVSDDSQPHIPLAPLKALVTRLQDNSGPKG